MFDLPVMSDETAAALGLELEGPAGSSLELAQKAWEQYFVMVQGRGYPVEDCAYARMFDALQVLFDEISEEMEPGYRDACRPVMDRFENLDLSFTVLGESYYQAARIMVRKHVRELDELAEQLQVIYAYEQTGRLAERVAWQELEFSLGQATGLLGCSGLTGEVIGREALTKLYKRTRELDERRAAQHEAMMTRSARLLLLDRINEARVCVARSIMAATRALYWFDEWHHGE